MAAAVGMTLLGSPPVPAATRSRASERRPVLLATLGAPIVEEAARVALAAASESGRPLILANVTVLEPLRLSLVFGYDALEELTPETSASLRGFAERARALRIPVERLRIRSPRPDAAVVELIAERDPGLVVFGPDRRRVSRRLWRKVIEALRDEVGRLVWLPA